jgi:hypothetical protein
VIAAGIARQKGQTMEESRRMAIERACERLIIAYTHFVDSGEAERVVDLFAPDGVCELPTGRASGHEELRAFFRARAQNRGLVTRHICTNAAIDVVDEHSANGRVYLTLYRYQHEDSSPRGPAPLHGPVFVGEYQDRFVLLEGGWRIAHRRAVAGFVPRATEAPR